MEKISRNICMVPIYGALDGGSLMSHVDLKKWQCCMSLSLILPNVAWRI